MPRKPFIGLHADCPDLSGAIPDMEVLPALEGLVADVDVYRGIPDKGLQVPWSPDFADCLGCTVKMVPGEIILCDGTRIPIVPGGDVSSISTVLDCHEASLVDVYENSKFWIEENVITGTAIWREGDTFPPERQFPSTYNIRIWEVGLPSTLTKVVASDIIDGLELINGELLITVKECADADAAEEACDIEHNDNGYRLQAVITHSNMTDKEKLQAFLKQVNKSRTATAYFPKFDTDGDPYILTISTTTTAVLGSPVAFNCENKDHALTLLSSIYQYHDAAIPGYMPGDCDDWTPWEPIPDDCCTMRVYPGHVVLDGARILVEPDDVDLCANRFHWLAINNEYRISLQSNDISFPPTVIRGNDSTDFLYRNIPLFESGNTSSLKSIPYSGAINSATITIGGDTGYSKTISLGSELRVAHTGTSAARMIAAIISAEYRCAAIVIPSTSDPLYSGTILTMATSNDEKYIDTTIAMYNLDSNGSAGAAFNQTNDYHCKLLRKSIVRFEEGDISIFIPKKPWRPYDIQINGSTATTRFAGGTVVFTDGSRLELGPYREAGSTGSGSASDASGDSIDMSADANKLYVVVDSSTRTAEWLLTEDCVPSKAGSKRYWPIAEFGLAGEIHQLEIGDATTSVSDGEYTYLVTPVEALSSATPGDKEILVPKGETYINTAAALAMRLTANSKTKSAIAWETGSGATSKAHIVATSTNEDEFTGSDISMSGSPDSNAKGYLLANSFKYSEGAFVVGQSFDFKAQFEITSIKDLDVRINDGEVIWDDNDSVLVEPDDNDSDRFDEVLTLSASNFVFWLEVVVIVKGSGASSISLEQRISCKSGTNEDMPERRFLDGSRICNRIKVAGTVDLSSLSRFEYDESDTTDFDITTIIGDTLEVDDVTYTFVADAASVSDPSDVAIRDTLVNSYESMAATINRHSANVVALHVPECGSDLAGEILFGTYDGVAAYSTSLAFNPAEESHVALAVSGLVSYCGRAPVEVLTPEDYNLHAFKVVSDGEGFYMLPGKVYIWTESGTTAVDIDGTDVTTAMAVQINFDDPPTAELVTAFNDVQGADTLTTKHVLLHELVSGADGFHHRNINHLHPTGIIAANTTLPVPPDPTQDYIFTWDGQEGAYRWKTPSGTDSLLYMTGSGGKNRVAWLQATNTLYQVVSVDAGRFKVDWPRISKP